MTEKNTERNAAVCAAFQIAGGQRNAITRIAEDFSLTRQRVHSILQAEGLIPARRGKEVTSNMPKQSRFNTAVPGFMAQSDMLEWLKEYAASKKEGNIAATLRQAVEEFRANHSAELKETDTASS